MSIRRPEIRSPSVARARPAATIVITVLAAAGAVGALLMMLAHVGLRLPLLGSTPRIPAVALGFAVGTGLFALVAVGAWRRRRWSWPLALAVNATGFASAVLPWRGVERSGLPAAVTLAALLLLVSRPGRQALGYAHGRRDPAGRSVRPRR